MRIALPCLLLAACSHTAPTVITTPTAGPPRSPITLTYFGVAGWQIDHAPSTILIDPYFSRPDLDGLVQPDLVAIAAHAPARADIVLVAHTHVDHALDAPTVAQRTGARLLGTTSTIALGRASGLATAQLIPVRGGEDYAFAGFSVQVIPALHSALEDKTTLGGVIEGTPTLPMTFDDYAEGGTLAFLVRVGGHQVFVLSSANFIEREITGLRPDIAIVGVGLRDEIYDYTCRLLTALGRPPVVIANHFDDWKAAPIDEPVSDDLRAFTDEVEACAPGTRVIVPSHFAPMTFD